MLLSVSRPARRGASSTARETLCRVDQRLGHRICDFCARNATATDGATTQPARFYSPGCRSCRTAAGATGGLGKDIAEFSKESACRFERSASTKISNGKSTSRRGAQDDHVRFQSMARGAPSTREDQQCGCTHSSISIDGRNGNAALQSGRNTLRGMTLIGLHAPF